MGMRAKQTRSTGEVRPLGVKSSARGELVEIVNYSPRPAETDQLTPDCCSPFSSDAFSSGGGIAIRGTCHYRPPPLRIVFGKRPTTASRGRPAGCGVNESP